MYKNEDVEIWKVIEGYKDYQISSHGYVYSDFSQKLLKFGTATDGYLHVKLYSGRSKGKTLSVHRIVAKAFLNLIDSKERVRHVNGIKADNRVCNLVVKQLIR